MNYLISISTLIVHLT